MVNEKFKREVHFSPAFDKRNDIPSKNYGVGAVRIFFLLKGKKGTVQFQIGTNWYLPETVKEYNKKGSEYVWEELEKYYGQVFGKRKENKELILNENKKR